jgi:uncharacterized protein (TIGR02996 family)
MTADPAELNDLLAHCAGTHDDTPRLVLADWLEEHGDFRGEFVRAAVAFGRTPPYDITRFQLGERLRALLETPAFKKWLPASPAFKWGWRGGLLSLSVDVRLLQTEDPTEVAGWLASSWIERVEFGYTSSRPRWEDTFGLVRNTRELHFDTDNYGAKALSRLREWPHLRWLGLSYLMEPWAELAALPHLRALKLDNPDWTMMPELHKASLPNLEVLSLDKEWNDDLPHWATCFPKLRSLTLTQYNAYPDEQCERFAECSGLRHLGFFQKYEPFTRVGLKAFAKLKELRSFDLWPMPRGTIAGLAKLSKLEHLATGGEAKPIRGLESLTQLRWLSLGVDTLTRGMAAQVLGLPDLARLDLHFSAVEAGAIVALAKAPALRALTVTPGDGEFPLAELGRLEHLRYLWIRDRDLTQPELRSLQTALPACRILQGSPDRDEDYDWSCGDP